MIRLSNYVM